jgi:hypothetical protein
VLARFPLPRDGATYTVLWGVYPPHYAQKPLEAGTVDAMFNCQTSRHLQRLWGHTNFHWIDLCPFAPLYSNSDVQWPADFDEMPRGVVREALSFLAQAARMMAAHVQEAGERCVVYVCGPTALAALRSPAAAEFFGEEDEVAHGVGHSVRIRTLVHTDQTVWFVHGPHPSYWMHTHTVFDREELDEVLGVVGLLRQGATTDDLRQARSDAAVNDSRRHRDVDAAFTAHYAGTGIPSAVRDARFRSDSGAQSIINMVTKLPWPRSAWESPTLVRFANTPTAFSVLVLNKFTHKQVCTLLHSQSFCSRIGDERFEAALASLVSHLGREAAVTLFSTDSFCTRIGDERFEAALASWVKSVGPKRAVTLFSTDSFCTRIGDDGFEAALTSLISQFGRNAAVTLLSSGSLCTRIGERPFDDALASLVSDLGRENAVKLVSCNSFSSRIGNKDGKFAAALASLVRQVGPGNAVKLCSRDNFCCRLIGDDDGKFAAAFAWFVSQLGADNAASLFSMGFFSARVSSDSEQCVQLRGLVAAALSVAREDCNATQRQHEGNPAALPNDVRVSIVRLLRLAPLRVGDVIGLLRRWGGSLAHVCGLRVGVWLTEGRNGTPAWKVKRARRVEQLLAIDERTVAALATRVARAEPRARRRWRRAFFNVLARVPAASLCADARLANAATAAGTCEAFHALMDGVPEGRLTGHPECDAPAAARRVPALTQQGTITSFFRPANASTRADAGVGDAHRDGPEDDVRVPPPAVAAVTAVAGAVAAAVASAGAAAAAAGAAAMAVSAAVAVFAGRAVAMDAFLDDFDEY